MKRWILPVKKTENGENFIELNDEIVQETGFKVGDKIKWVDNLDGSFTIMNADMRQNYFLSTEMFNPAHNRTAKIFTSNEDVHYIIDMYEGEELVHSRKIVGHNECFAEDCIENWVMGYGEFKK